MTIYHAEEGRDIIIGRQGEYNATQIIFDLTELKESVGEGTAALVHYPYNGEPYIVPATVGETYDAAVQEGTELTWTIGQLATMHHGDGVVVANWIAETGLKKSVRYKTKCYKSIGTATTITDAQQSYIDQMTQLSTGMLNDLQEAENDIDEKIGDVQEAIAAANSKIEEVEAAGSAAVAAAQAAANVTVVGECLVYGGGASNV